MGVKNNKLDNWTNKAEKSKYSFRDCWPWMIESEIMESPEKTIKLHTIAAGMFIKNTPDYDLSEKTLEIIQPHLDSLYKVKRWQNFGQIDMGDMNGATHTLRQTGIVGQALEYDAQSHKISDYEKNLMLSAALTHDLGEIEVGDITYDLKTNSDGVREAVAVKNMILGSKNFDTSDKYKIYQAYLQISMKLNQNEIDAILPEPPEYKIDPQWKKMNKLFHLYERYSYLITAIQAYPFMNKSKQFFSDKLLKTLATIDRAKLEKMMNASNDVPAELKKATLYKNVILNQWPHIIKANSENTKSTRLFFNNPVALARLKQGKELMGLDVDLSILD